MGCDEVPPFMDAPLGRPLLVSLLTLLVALLGLGTSLLENMRVSRSFNGAFSALSFVGFSEESVSGGENGEPLGGRPEGSGVVTLDLAASWDLIDEGFELGVDVGFESSGK
jgi:hypothetical protein